MSSYRSSRWLTVLPVATAILAVIAVVSSGFGAGRAHAQQAPGLGAPIILEECTHVVLTVQASDAQYTSVFWRSPDGSLGVTSKQAGTVIDLGEIQPGELKLGIYVQDTSRTYWTGAGGDNPDGLPHAIYDGSSVGFEDQFKGGDFDYNDAVLSIALAPCAPELVTLTVSVDPTGTGFGIVSGGGSYPIGSVAHPLASAGGGSFLTNWSGDCTGTANTADVLMNADKHCVARFDAAATPTPTATPTISPTSSPTATPTPVVEGAEIGIDNTRTSPSPAEVGDQVTFRIDVTLTSVPAANEAQVLVQFDDSHLAYQGASWDGVDLSQCQLIGIGVSCDFGNVTENFSFNVNFSALAITPSTATDATLGADFDGPGAGAAATAGPASADVAIVDVAGIQLPPLGDGSMAAAAGAGGGDALPLSAGIVLLGAVAGLGLGAARRRFGVR